MKIFIINKHGDSHEVDPKHYERLCRRFAAIEVNNLDNRRLGTKGSVAIYTTSGSHKRFYGSKYLEGDMPTLWRIYQLIFSIVGLEIPRAIQSKYFGILKGYARSGRYKRCVVFLNY